MVNETHTPFPEKVPEPGYYYHYKHDSIGTVNNYAYYVHGVGHHTEDDCRAEDQFMLVYQPLYDAYVYTHGKMFDLRPIQKSLHNCVLSNGKCIPRNNNRETFLVAEGHLATGALCILYCMNLIQYVLMSNIFVSGSLAYDRIMTFGGMFQEHLLPENLSHISVSFTTTTFIEGFGGTAGNIAYSLALLGERPTIIATVGTDFEKYATWLESHTIDTSSIEIASDVPTASAYITTDAADNQIASFYLGAMVRPYTKPIALDRDTETIAIIAPGNNVDMVLLAQQYVAAGINYLYDPGQQSIMLSPEELRAGIAGAGVLFANEYEMGLLIERTGWTREEIAAHVPVIVMTLAEEGTLLIAAGVETHIPAVAVAQVVDPTGAGDAYRAGFIKGMQMHLALELSVKLAGTVAAYAVEKKGTQNHSFTMGELQVRYAGAYGEPFPL
jgi:adenosine kinase